MKLMNKLLIFSLLYFSLSNLSAENLEENLRAAIRENNPTKVEVLLEEDMNVNYIYPDTKKTVLYEALQNLEKQSKQIFLGKILGPIFAGSMIIGGIFSRNLVKNSVRNASNFIDDYRNVGLKEAELQGTAFYQAHSLQNDISDFKKNQLQHENKIQWLKAKNGSAKDIAEEERLLNSIKETLKFDTENLKRWKDMESNPKKYVTKRMQEDGIKALGGFLSVIGLIIGTIGLIYKGKKIYDSLTNAQKIALMIQNQPDFKLDLDSAEFIKQKLPKYSKILENK